MKKSTLSIGCQTLLRESESQTIPWYKDESSDELGDELFPHIFLPNGFVTMHDIKLASSVHPFPNDNNSPSDPLISSCESPEMAMGDYATVSRSCFIREQSQRSLARAQMDFMHKLDLKRHVLQANKNRAANLNSHTRDSRIKRRCSKLDQLGKTIEGLGSLEAPSFHGNGSITEYHLTPLERKDLQKKLNLLESAIHSLNTVPPTT